MDEKRIGYMDDTNGRYFSEDQIITGITVVSTAILFLISFIRVLNITDINQIVYYLIVTIAFLLLIGSIVYDDFISGQTAHG